MLRKLTEEINANEKKISKPRFFRGKSTAENVGKNMLLHVVNLQVAMSTLEEIFKSLEY